MNSLALKCVAPVVIYVAVLVVTFINVFIIVQH